MIINLTYVSMMPEAEPNAFVSASASASEQVFTNVHFKMLCSDHIIVASKVIIDDRNYI
jgi:hypothetical protein